MSDQRISAGLIAKLNTPLDYESWESHLAEHGLFLNYEGTAICNTILDEPSYDYSFKTFDDSYRESFIKDVIAAGVDFDPSTVKYYFSHWYDGTDAPHWEFRLDDVGME